MDTYAHFDHGGMRQGTYPYITPCRRDSRETWASLATTSRNEPNVGFAGNIVLLAMRDVGGGGTHNRLRLFDDYDGQMECQCADAALHLSLGPSCGLVTTAVSSGHRQRELQPR
jgi:hypothetical protein